MTWTGGTYSRGPLISHSSPGFLCTGSKNANTFQRSVYIRADYATIIKEHTKLNTYWWMNWCHQNLQENAKPLLHLHQGDRLFECQIQAFLLHVIEKGNYSQE